jgi:putative glutamine amidotransferase
MARQPYHSAMFAGQAAREAGRRRPVVGLSTYREPAAWGVWHESADLLPASYADAVSAAGAVPVLLPPAIAEADLSETAASVLDTLDGLVLAGGADVDPARYGAGREPQTGAPRPDRDSWELALARAALGVDLPILAICRGMQVLAVAGGGTLVQHLPDVVGHDGHCPTPGVHGRHEVLLESGRLRAVLGDRVTVATYHHQAVDRPGAGLEITGRCADGTIEAVESSAATWAVGVQWHPEAFDGAALFADFVRACARFRSRAEAAV